MSNTPVLGLPEIAEGVASQTVLHNQALRLIEARIVRVLSRTTAAPPGSPAEGDSYIVPAGATGVWAGLTDQVASFVGGGWVYYTPGEGVRVWVNDADETVVFDGAAWVLSEGSAGGSGDVVGPASSTDGHFATYDGATGKLLKDTLALDTDTTLAADSDIRIASQKAVKAYVTASGGGGGAVRLDQITAGTADSTLTTTGTVALSSGVGAANTVGKTLAIQPGAGGATNAAGGPLNLTGGSGAGSGAGGAVTVTGGTPGATGTGGAANIRGGTASGSFETGGAASMLGGTGGPSAAGGAISIQGGTGGTTNGPGGAVTISPGNGASGGGQAGTLTIGGLTTTGPTAGINITGTASSAAAQAGGAVNITAGAAPNATSGTGGALTLSAGAATAGNGGAATFRGGNGAGTGGAGGTANVNGGSGAGTNSPAGNVNIRPGASTGSGNPGNIQLDGGRGAALATSATGGFVTLPTCAGTPTGTPVNVPTGSVATIVDTSGSKLWMFIGGAWKGYVNIDEAQNTTNRIINGKMAIDQRNAGAEIAGGLPVTDRWSVPALPAVTASMAAGRKVLSPGVYYLMVKATVAQPVISTSETCIRQIIEGLNLADLGYGTANASPLTLAFEVRSTIIGTGTVALRGATPLQYYVTTFPVTTSFTTVVVTIPGATTGTWEVGTGPGFYVDWGLTISPTTTAPVASTAWAVGNHFSVTGATNFMATVGNEYHLRNVRLYKGSVDFGPDRRLYAEELALCQRYYSKSYNIDTAPGAITNAGAQGMVCYVGTAFYNGCAIRFPQRMRATPTVGMYSPITGAANLWRANGAAADTVVTGTFQNEAGLWLQNGSAVAVSELVFGHWTASSEL